MSRFRFIAAAAGRRPVALSCRALGVSRAGYYAWRERPPSARARADAALTAVIHRLHGESRGVYGSPRIHAELRAGGRRHGRKRVARLMRAAGLRGCPRPRRRPRTTVADPAAAAAPNLVQRRFDPLAPDRLWLADITYVPTEDGWLYLAAVLDAFSRRVVGWAMADHLRTELVLDALDLALASRRPAAGLVHHSDRGCQGEFNWSSQHQGGEELRWQTASDADRIGRGGPRCDRLVGRRWRDARTGSGSGRRSGGGSPARTRGEGQRLAGGWRAVVPR